MTVGSAVDLSVLSQMGQAITVAPGTALLSQGEVPRSVYCLTSGATKSVHTDADGRRIVVGISHCPAMIGSVALTLGLESPVDVHALLPSTLIAIGRHDFLTGLAEQRDVALCVGVLHAREIYDQIQSYSELGTATVRARLIKLLHAAACAQGRWTTNAAVDIESPLGRQDMAEALACSVEHLCRVMAQLEREGALSRRKRTITIRNPGKLFGEFPLSNDVAC